MKNKFYQVTPSVVVNLDYLHSIVLNEDGEKGWLRMVKEVNGKMLIYPIMIEHKHLNGMPIEQIAAWLKSSEGGEV